jgi:hypothetical protein
MPATMAHSGKNRYGYNPKSYRKLRRQLEAQYANPVPKPEDYWKPYWSEEKAKEDWTAPAPQKSEAELLKEEIEKNLKGWPWNGVPQKLLTVVRVSFSQSIGFGSLD